MSLNDVKLNCTSIIKEINIDNYQTKIRLMELGLNVGTRVIVKHKSLLKKTLLVAFENSCFTLKENFARNIVVEYA